MKGYPKPGEPFNPYCFFKAICLLPSGLVRCRAVSQGAKVVWGVLNRYSGQNGYCWPSRAALEDALGISESQVKCYLKELEDEGFIKIDRGCGRGNTNRYVFLWHESLDSPEEWAARDRANEEKGSDHDPFSQGSGRDDLKRQREKGSKTTPQTSSDTAPQGVRERPLFQPEKGSKTTPGSGSSIDGSVEVDQLKRVTPRSSREPNDHKNPNTIDPSLLKQMLVETMGCEPDGKMFRSIQDAVRALTLEQVRACLQRVARQSPNSYAYVLKALKTEAEAALIDRLPRRLPDPKPERQLSYEGEARQRADRQSPNEWTPEPATDPVEPPVLLNRRPRKPMGQNPKCRTARSAMAAASCGPASAGR